MPHKLQEVPQTLSNKDKLNMMGKDW